MNPYLRRGFWVTRTMTRHSSDVPKFVQHDVCRYHCRQQSFCEVIRCANTPKCSLFNMRKTAEKDGHIFKHLEVSVASTRRRGWKISVSTLPFCELHICTNTVNYSLVNARKTAEKDSRVFELLEVSAAGTRRRGMADLREYSTILWATHMY